MTTTQCEAIKAKLPKGSRMEISKKTGLTLGYIDKVLNGSRFNKHVFHIAFDIIGSMKEDEQSVENRYEALFSQMQ